MSSRPQCEEISNTTKRRCQRPAIEGGLCLQHGLIRGVIGNPGQGQSRGYSYKVPLSLPLPPSLKGPIRIPLSPAFDVIELSFMDGSVRSVGAFEHEKSAWGCAYERCDSIRFIFRDRHFSGSVSSETLDNKGWKRARKAVLERVEGCTDSGT
jgi:hypothetical protein